MSLFIFVEWFIQAGIYSRIKYKQDAVLAHQYCKQRAKAKFIVA